jgi:phenylacetate-CoA ligase
MGVWIGGTITFQAFEMAGRSGYPMSIITPGINKEETFKALKKLAPYFKQIILAGYPPLIKDIIDEAPGRGIRLKNLNISSRKYYLREIILYR